MNTPPNREVVIFSSALELDPVQRVAYLDKACAGDPALRQQIETLLAVHTKAIPFLEPPTREAQISAQDADTLILIKQGFDCPAEKAGDRIGRYKLLQQIGEGGCGVVYMAEQEEPVRRRVALKVIKLGMDTKQVIARFEAERQALAMMDHPNIAKVFDAGATGTGRPYFVMELVRGVKITDYCDEKNLSTEQRLGLFVQVCQAIQHAHQKGIIHRDIKPSNILLTVNDGVAVPKVIDFGIAKATADQRLTDKTVFTAFEQFIGTPAYMSPEQAEITSVDVDTRSDIYSLGVLLYELLTGTTPFDARELLQVSLDEMRRTIREKEPERPSTRVSTLGAETLTSTARRRGLESPRLVRVLQGDLDWIVMKCLEKDRARRYGTANGLAHDIERHLKNETVAARPPSKLYRLQKSVHRNKLAYTAAVAVSVALVAGLLISAWGLVKAQQARHEAERHRLLAETKEIEAHEEAAKSQQVARLLEDMLKGVGPAVARGRDTTLLREILNQTAQRVGKGFTNQLRVELELRGTIGRIYNALAEYPAAEAMLNEAVRLCRKLPVNNEPQLADLLADLGLVLWRESKFTDAQPLVLEAVALRRKTTDEMGRRGLAVALNNLASVLGEFNLHDAEAALREALDIQKRILNKDDPELLMTLGGLAHVLRRENKLAEAETILREILATTEALPGDQDLNLAGHLNSLGLVLRDKGELAEAEFALRRALDLRRKIYPKEHADLAQSLSNLGRVLVSKGDLKQAENYFNQALAMRRIVFSNGSEELAQNLSDLGQLFEREGKLLDAEASHREAFNLRRKLRGDNKGTYATFSLANLGSVLEAEGKLEEARTLYADLATGNSALAATAQFRLAELYRAGKGVPADPAEAVKWYHQSAEHGNKAAEFMLGQAYAEGSGVSKDIHEAATWYRKAAENGHETARNSLLRALITANNFEEAEELCRGVIQRQITQRGKNDSSVAASLGDLVDVLVAEKKFMEAEGIFRTELERRWNELGEDDSVAPVIVNKLLHMLLSQGKIAEAKTLVREEQEKRRKRVGKDATTTTEPLISIAWWLYQQGQPAGAETEAALKEIQKGFGGEAITLSVEALEHLGVMLLRQGRNADAETIFRAQLDIRRKTIGARMETSHSLSWLGGSLEAQGKLAQAEEAYREALEIRRKYPGNELWVASSFFSLVSMLQRQGKLREAEQCYHEFLDACFNAQGIRASQCARCARSLVEFLKSQKKQTEAEDFTMRLLSELRQSSGERQMELIPPLLPFLADFTRAHLAKEEFAKAESLARECLAIGEKLTPEDWLTFDSKSLLGGSQLGQKHYAAAESLLLSGYEGMKEREGKIPLGGKARVKEAIQRLVKLYEETVRTEQAADWRQKLAEFDYAGPLPPYGIPRRQAQALTNLIDLSAFYNAGFMGNWHNDQPDNDLSEMPVGIQMLAKTQFDVRGLVQLRGVGPSSRFPTQMAGLPTRGKCRRIHFLHGAIYATESSGTVIGKYVFHYADGTIVERPIVLGKDVLDWWVKPPALAAQDGLTIAWTGQNGKSRDQGLTIQLYKATWENPNPEAELTNIDFISARKTSAPFLVAMTMEP